MSAATFEDAIHPVLLVEDNPGDARLISEVMAENKKVHLHTVMDAVQAIHFLTKREEFTNAPTPDLIILDLGLPIFSGKALLEERRRRKICESIPVVVLTTTHNERLDCMVLGATEYLIKPADWPHWQDLIRRMLARFLTFDPQS